MSNASWLLPMHLSVHVPLLIAELRAGGGPTEEDLVRVQGYLPDLLTCGDQLFFRSTRPGETAQRVNQVAEAIAVLSFQPGGITVFDQHWESEHGGQ